MVSEIAKSRVEETEKDGISKIVRGLDVFFVSSLSGYKFTSEGQGAFDHYFFPLGTSSYLEITTNFSDPGNSGYSQKVEKTLATLDILANK